MSDLNLNFLLARTDKNFHRPYFDDLSHHNLVIGFSQLHLNDPSKLMAGLMHDYFKGLFIIKKTNQNIQWIHCDNSIDYGNFIPKEMTNIDKNLLNKYIKNHHQREIKDINENPIRCAELNFREYQGIARNMETNIFVSNKIYGMKNFEINPKSRYHWFIIYLIHQELKENLTDIYSQKLEDLVGINSIEYQYIPIELNGSINSIPDAFNNIPISNFYCKIEDKKLIIKIPVKNLKTQSNILYNNSDIIRIQNNTLIIPFGEALTFFTFIGNNVSLFYVDPGIDFNLKTILNKMIENYINISKYPYSLQNLNSSLNETFQGELTCSSCNSPASKIIDAIGKKSKFTDSSLLFNDSGIACPVCYAGYLIEFESPKKFSYIEPQEVEIYDIDIPPQFPLPVTDNFALSASGLIWLQLLSSLWYQLFYKNQFINFVLDPSVILYPLKIRFAPRAFFPISWKSLNKKFCLQSSIKSELSLLGYHNNISIEEFKEISKAYRNNDTINGKKMISKIKNLYGIR